MGIGHVADRIPYATCPILMQILDATVKPIFKRRRERRAALPGQLQPLRQEHAHSIASYDVDISQI